MLAILAVGAVAFIGAGCFGCFTTLKLKNQAGGRISFAPPAGMMP
jgi:hypothetical protein